MRIIIIDSAAEVATGNLYHPNLERAFVVQISNWGKKRKSWLGSTGIWTSALIYTLIPRPGPESENFTESVLMWTKVITMEKVLLVTSIK